MKKLIFVFLLGLISAAAQAADQDDIMARTDTGIGPFRGFQPITATELASPVAGDMIPCWDFSNSYALRVCDVDNLPGGGGAAFSTFAELNALVTDANLVHDGSNNTWTGIQTFAERSSDIPDPPEGHFGCWMSDGTGAGNDGDVLCKVTAGGSTYIAKQFDIALIDPNDNRIRYWNNANKADEWLVVGSGLEIVAGVLNSTAAAPACADITDGGTAGCSMLQAETAGEQRLLLNVENGAAADQTGPEIESILDVSLGNVDWKKPVGTAAGTVAAGNDSRLSDARTPTAHAGSHAENGSDEVLVEDHGTACAIDLILKSDGSGGLLCAADETGDVSSGEANTISSPEGALALTHSTPKSGVNLRLISASSTDFSLAADVLSIAATIPRIIASGSVTFNPASIASGACASQVSGGTATGVAATDRIIWNPDGDPTTLTGYAPSTDGGIHIWAYPATDNVYFKACNNTASAIDPGSMDLNWMVLR